MEPKAGSSKINKINISLARIYSQYERIKKKIA